MLNLKEWLDSVGFGEGNPFALKQADEEGLLLIEYFVEHPAYNAMLDADAALPRSAVLHATRGAGKTSTRRMFESYCQTHAQELRALLIPLMDWMPLVQHTHSTHIQEFSIYLGEIFRRAILALALEPDTAWQRTPSDPDLAGYLNWLCVTYNQYLTPKHQALLEQRGWLRYSDPQKLAIYSMQRMTVVQSLAMLVNILREVGYLRCYLLVDRIDELFETTKDWQAGAELIAPLIGNLQLLEIPGLAFKYFIPSEIMDILRERGLLREDRIGCFDLRWDGEVGRALLASLLQRRLRVFSNQRIRSLASLAVPDMRDIDRQLCEAAAGVPRQLLNLGDLLFKVCADAADEQSILIKRQHFLAACELAEQRRQERSARDSVRAPAQVAPAVVEQSYAAAALSAQQPGAEPTIPPLVLKRDGNVWRGNELLPKNDKMPKLQRRLLSFLYANRHRMCSIDEITAYVWQESRDLPSSDDSLNKVVERLRERIEPNPKDPIYLKRVTGGFYRLDNTAAEEE